MANDPITRASPTLQDIIQLLGPLTDLIGRWVGKGFNLISVPDTTDDLGFRLKLNATWETLEFTPLGGVIPNRGSKQPDLFFTGLNYRQDVSDAESNEALHVEMGQWLNIPEIPANAGIPKTDSMLIRQATILHGSTLLATGTRSDVTLPPFPEEDSTPKGAKVTEDYRKRFEIPDPLSLPPTIKGPFVKNPNQYLAEALDIQKNKGQTLTNPTISLQISTTLDNPPAGGISSMPFISNNATLTRFDAIFWIETIIQKDGPTFMQMQYTQKIILNFDDIDWPHISVATLVKQ
jgi:hypothetical protein